MILALPVLSHSMLMLSEEELACAADPDAETQWWHFVARKFNQLISASGFGPSFGCADPGMESKALQRDRSQQEMAFLTTDLKLELLPSRTKKLK